MDPLWIVAAFIFGAASSRISLPPLVGYLVAGFVLNGFGIEGSDTLGKIADTGVTLLLFTIGLKLKLKSLAKPEVWAGATIHMLITVAVFGAGIWILGVAGMPYFHLLGWQTTILIAFALSFSSTVFAVKVLEEKKEMASRHAATAIGILIMQDIIAVVFLSASAGKVPSPWAAVLAVSLFIIRPLLTRLMTQCGHGELLMLFGILLALPDPKAGIFAIRQMHQRGYQGQVTASVRYEDEIRILKQEGIDAACSLYTEAGVGFADHACAHMDHCHIQDAGLTS